MGTDANAEAIEAWDTVLFDKFVRFRDTVTRGLAAHGSVALDRCSPRAGARVLDVGCGFGDTTVELARMVGAKGEAVGVDAAARFIDVATRDAKAAGVANARFFVADVEAQDLGGPYDAAFSRFGTMFFASAVRALRNIRRALAENAALTMVVWRKKDENPWITLVEERVLEIVPRVEPKDQVTCGPGPFSMASADVVSAQFLAAGFARVTFERLDVDLCIGHDLDEAVEFSMAFGPPGEILRLAGAIAERKRPEVVAALKDLLAPYARADGVHLGSSSWIVTATV